ncbi:MAG TPA: hypothetical protein VFT48_03525, partial [Pyrinomonadaceae bacterium]|nr:hypothetical protein [Pyrinomonadaceae bacterium]
DGLIHVTKDGGKTWKNVTPPAIDAWSKISQIDASHFDINTAYVAVNRIRLDDQKPHIYRTKDGGTTWQEIVMGLPDGPVNTVKEDPQKRGLLFAGTELAVFFSINDGNSWQPLRLNMPATSIRDLVIHNDDVVVGTHGRSFWILDDITPLRQLNETVINSAVHLFAPQVAYRVKRNVNTDTPLPPEEPAGQNPPDGAIINYYFKNTPTTPVVLEIINNSNQVIRRFSSDDKPIPVNPNDHAVPEYWFRPHQPLVAKAGMQRFVWDLKYAPPKAFGRGFPISAIYRDTPLYPLGPSVLGGSFTIRFTANGKTLTQHLMVKMDPRVTAPVEDLVTQFAVSLDAYNGMQTTFDAVEQIRKLRAQIKDSIERVDRGPLAEALNALDKKAAAIGGDGGSQGLAGGTIDMREPNLTRLNGGFSSLLEHLQSADVAPTQPMLTASSELQKILKKLLADWESLKTTDVMAINDRLEAANKPVLKP